jgi:hypothetical protein
MDMHCSLLWWVQNFKIRVLFGIKVWFQNFVEITGKIRLETLHIDVEREP